MRRNTTTWGMIAASGALVLTLAACGEDSPEVEEPNAGAEAGAEEIEPAAFVEQLKSPGMDAMTSFTMNMDMQMQGEAVTMMGKADLSGSPAMDINMEMPGMGSVHMIMVDGNAYMSVPGMTEEGQFVQMPLQDIMGEDADEFTNQIDMTSQWDAWETGAQRITFVGPEDVDGESLNHYELLLDTSALEDEAAAGMPGGEITYDVWLDDQNFMRQVTFDLEGAETVMKMDDWGQPVDIAAPDASSIVEMPGMPTSDSPGEQGMDQQVLDLLWAEMDATEQQATCDAFAGAPEEFIEGFMSQVGTEMDEAVVMEFYELKCQ